MLDLNRIATGKLHSRPYTWGQIDQLYRPEDAAKLASTYPRDHFKTLTNRGGEKEYDYEARSLIRLGNNFVSHAAELDPVWLELGSDLRSPGYRAAMSTLTGLDLSQAPLEVNVFHYAPGNSLGPHPDLSDKVVTHVLYFNKVWNKEDGGCLQILGSRDANDIVDEVLPLVGNSAVLVRSDTSWHAVSRVAAGCGRSRRSVTVTFYRAGADSSMWPANDPTPLHTYTSTDEDAPRPASTWGARLRRLFSPG